ncbi:hypothetical protein [Erythrobacter tepidarius]|uniref:hypothetical protein n=1 Tax=Erythrobacter tepidarius TaxID=60454 RepID=UPI000A383843|nr:hypothetical protein [Erythrobacter tepidarius]
MRTALIAALKRTGSGTKRAELTLAGRTVLARQVDWLRHIGCERIFCLCEHLDGEVLRLQQECEATGGHFQALRGFLHLPALVRAEDELVILADGLLPDPAIAAALFAQTPARFVAALTTGSPLVTDHPHDFERIDARQHWAGLLAMRGAPVQHLADFPPDSDPISLLLRLALQAGTPCRRLPDDGLAPASWLLATDETALKAQEQALIARAAGAPDWRRPGRALGQVFAQALAPQALERGPLIAAVAGAALYLCALLAAWQGDGVAALALTGLGALAATLAGSLGRMAGELLGRRAMILTGEWRDLVVDLAAAAVLAMALAPVGAAAPLAALGPVLVGLARLTRPDTPLAVLADRIVLPAALASAAAFGVLPLVTALMSLLLLAGLLLRNAGD